MIEFLKRWRQETHQFYRWYFRKTWTHQIIMLVLAVAIALAISLTTRADGSLEQIARLYASIASRGYDRDRAKDLRVLGDYLRSQPDLPEAVRFLLYEFQLYETCTGLDQ